MRLLHAMSEAAELIGVGRSTLYELASRGDIKVVKIGRRTLVAHDELERFVAALADSGSHPRTAA